MDAILNSTLFNYLTVALGLGFVIFIHELGHFLIAKLHGVKVEAFAIGFGRPLLAYRKGLGLRARSTVPEYQKWLAAHPEQAELPAAQQAISETEYSIRAIPLGGFVKMLGEGDEADHEAARSTDPRAYPNKPVGARMAIISAGVIMNLLFGLAANIWIYSRGGLPTIPARVGGVVPGHPAYVAGLRPGDEILSANGEDDLDFLSLIRITAMSGKESDIDLVIQRENVPEPLNVDVKPLRQSGAMMKTMGIHRPSSLDLGKIEPFIRPAGMPEVANLTASLGKGRTIVAAGPEAGPIEPVTDALQLARLLDTHRDEPIVIRTAPTLDRDEAPAADRQAAPSSATTDVVLPPTSVVDFGFRMEMGPIVAVQNGSPAEEAGFQTGDRIVGVEGFNVIDPLRLPDQLAQRAGSTLTIQVSRSEAGKPEEIHSLSIVPRPISPWSQPSQFSLVAVNFDPQEVMPLEVPALGLAYRVPPRIAAVTPDSPAAKAGIEDGDILHQVTLTLPADPDKPTEPAPTLTVTLEQEAGSWPAVFAAIQSLPLHPVGIQTSRAKQPAQITPEPVPGWFFPARGLILYAEVEPLPPLPFSQASRRGFDATRDTLVANYAMFRSLFFGDISFKAVVGPVGIAGIASESARAGFVVFLQFLVVLSLGLAVINFLPIPPLDGGQLAFLIAEKLRGKPLPESVFNAGTIAGLIFVLGLMVLVLYQDVMRLFVG